jgi:VanZ family protein
VLKPTSKSLLRNWWPVVFWLGVIRAESSNAASAQNTGALLYKIISAIAPHIRPELVERLDAVLRKTGHFLGYAILSALVLLALRKTNRDRLRALLQRPWGSCLHDLWRMEWAMLSVILTIVTASLDEIHQSFIPSRTGAWQDVVLDTCGAIVVLSIMYRFCIRAIRARVVTKPQARLISTR